MSNENKDLTDTGPKVLTKADHPIVRGTVEIGFSMGKLFVCIGLYLGGWFIGIRNQLP